MRPGYDSVYPGTRRPIIPDLPVVDLDALRRRRERERHLQAKNFATFVAASAFVFLVGIGVLVATTYSPAPTHTSLIQEKAR